MEEGVGKDVEDEIEVEVGVPRRGGHNCGRHKGVSTSVESGFWQTLSRVTSAKLIAARSAVR